MRIGELLCSHAFRGAGRALRIVVAASLVAVVSTATSRAGDITAQPAQRPQRYQFCFQLIASSTCRRSGSRSRGRTGSRSRGAAGGRTWDSAPTRRGVWLA